MCKMNEQLLLSGQAERQVSWCTCCQKYSLYFKQVCFSFDESEIDEFRQFLEGLSPNCFQYYLQNEKQVLIKNELFNAGFFLSRDEVSEVVDLIAEAQLMFEVNEIISS